MPGCPEREVAQAKKATSKYRAALSCIAVDASQGKALKKSILNDPERDHLLRPMPPPKP